MKTAGRSAVLAVGEKDSDDETRIYALETVLEGIRNRHKRLGDIDGGDPVVAASDPRLEAMRKPSPSEAALRDVIQASLDRLHVRAMQFLDFEDPTETLMVQAQRIVLNLVTGERNPSGVSSAEFLITPRGAFIERFTHMITPPFEPQVSFAVIATDSEEIAGRYAVDPAWCTCNVDEDHMYPHRRHSTGDPCPQGDGTLTCG